MSVKSGAGASVASGAGYQARVAAYFVACRLAGMAVPIMQHGRPSKISMETNEAVDDLQIAFEGGKRAVVQAKRTISFSTSANSELASVFKQFTTQSENDSGAKDEDYYLVASSSSSKRVTGDMLAALDAARGCSPEIFERDQSKAIVSTYNDLVGLVETVSGYSINKARAVLAKTHVVALDVDPNSSIELAVILALHAKGYAAPSEMWGKLVADCLEWARRRQTVDLATVESSYTRLRPPEAAAQSTDPKYLKVSLSAEGFQVGREIVVARAGRDLSFIKHGEIGVMEFYRFDNDCRPRLRFEGSRFILGNGDELELLARFATWTGLNRFIDESIEQFGDAGVVIIPMNGDEDLESGLCAKTHRKALEPHLPSPRWRRQCQPTP